MDVDAGNAGSMRICILKKKIKGFTCLVFEVTNRDILISFPFLLIPWKMGSKASMIH